MARKYKFYSVLEHKQLGTYPVLLTVTEFQWQHQLMLVLVL